MPLHSAVEEGNSMPQNSRHTREVKEAPVPPAATEFENELRVYEQNKPKWLTVHASKFVVISREQVAGFFSSYSQAYDAATLKFGLDQQFLIKQVLPQDRIFVIY